MQHLLKSQTQLKDQRALETTACPPMEALEKSKRKSMPHLQMVHYLFQTADKANDVVESFD